MAVPLPPLCSKIRRKFAGLGVQEGHCDGAITATWDRCGTNAALTLPSGLCYGKAELFSLPAVSCCGIGCEGACVWHRVGIVPQFMGPMYSGESLVLTLIFSHSSAAAAGVGAG